MRALTFATNATINVALISGIFCIYHPGVAFALSDDTNGQLPILMLFIAAFCVLIYFIPTIIGSSRDVTNSTLLFIVNLLFGWTLIGWLLCIIWAAVGATKDQDAFYRNARNRLN